MAIDNRGECVQTKVYGGYFNWDKFSEKIPLKTRIRYKPDSDFRFVLHYRHEGVIMRYGFEGFDSFSTRDIPIEIRDILTVQFFEEDEHFKRRVAPDELQYFIKGKWRNYDALIKECKQNAS
jgi:hypothetical protein